MLTTMEVARQLGLSYEKVLWMRREGLIEAAAETPHGWQFTQAEVDRVGARQARISALGLTNPSTPITEPQPAWGQPTPRI